MIHRQLMFSVRTPQPVPIPPPYTYSEDSHLHSGNTAVFDYYGRSVAINDSASRLFVGSDETSGANVAGTGAVYAYTRTLGWNTASVVVLRASDGEINSSFGSSIAASSDGSTLVVGAPGARVDGLSRVGAAYVFAWDPAYGTWVQKQKLIASDAGSDDTFGYSVAISGDGTTIAVGANKDNVIPTYSVGSVYLWSHNGTSWSQQQKLVASDCRPDDNYGCSISLSDDGTILAVGSSGSDSSGVANCGAVYCYSRIYGVWGNEAKITQTTPVTGSGFGYSVDLNGAGTALIVGAPLAAAGSVHLFTRKSTGWSQRLTQTANSGVSGDRYGSSVAISTTGAFFAVGAPRRDIPTSESGAVYVYYNDGSGWVQTALLVDSLAGVGDNGGWSIAITPDAATIVSGAPLASTSSPTTIQGRVTIFSR